MNRALVAKCEKIRVLLARADNDEVLTRYEIGAIVNAVCAEGARYGNATVERIAAVVHCRGRTLYRHAAVARLLPREEFLRQQAETNAHGLPLSWTHWELLAAAGSDWESLRARALRDAWTTDRLEAEVKTQRLRPTMEAVEDTTSKHIELARAFLAEVGKEGLDPLAVLLDRLGRTPPNELTPDVVASLTGTLAETDAVTVRLTNLRQRLAVVLRRVGPPNGNGKRTVPPEDSP